MRQLFTIRLVVTVAALALLALLVAPVASVISSFSEDDQEVEAQDDEEEPTARVVDVVAPVLRVERSDDFEVVDGQTLGFVDVVLADRRTVRIAPGTYGEVECGEFGAVNECAMFADVLGDAIVWFALVPRADRSSVLLPPVLDLQDGYAVLENGWRIQYPPVIERTCAGEDIVSFSDFVSRFGPGSITVVDIETQSVVEVRCAAEGDPSATAVTTTTSTTLPDVELLDAPDAVPG